MAENKKSVLLYCDIIHTVEKLTDEQSGILFKHYLRYINDLNPKTDNLTEIIFEPIKQNLKRDLLKWDETKEKRSLAGKESARIRALKKEQTSTNPTSVESVKQTSTNPTVNVNVNVKGNVSKSIKKRERDFKESLTPYLEKYGKDLLNEFYFYWTEHGEKDLKMRFEKEKSFGIARRLGTWIKNENKFNNEKNRTNNKGFESDTTKEAVRAVANGFVDYTPET